VLGQNDFRKIISGRSDGITAQVLRIFLVVISQVYLIIIVLRNYLYSKEWLKIKKADAVVISVGNITTGGTGKTPLVVWLCKNLQHEKIFCAILTRGYKATKDRRIKTQDRSDEPAILSEMCPKAKLIVNPDRIAGAKEAVNRFGARLLIMDDGFQHRRLARDIDIVTIDATQPFGYGRLFPAGLLREPVNSIKRADAVVITRSNQASDSELKKIEAKVQKIKSDMIIARAVHSPVIARTTDDKEISIELLKDKKIFAFCGIGNPDAFINTMGEFGAKTVGSKIYDDHYHYADKDIADICTEAANIKADLILTTQKDFSRLSIEKLRPDIPFAYLAIELKLVSGEDAITRLIKNALAGKMVEK
jgi:tetraacyldisaccharide 4'-kinase